MLPSNTPFCAMKRNNRRLLAASSTASAAPVTQPRSGPFKISTGNFVPASNAGRMPSNPSPKTLALMKNLPVWPSGETISVPPQSTTNEPGASVPSAGTSSFASVMSGAPSAPVERANAALLAASRGAEPRTAEAARSYYPPAIRSFMISGSARLDPANIPLRRELAYLFLEMGNRDAAEAEFRRITDQDKDDALSAAQLGFLLLNRNQLAAAMPLLERALKSDDDAVTDRVREALRMPKALKKRPEAPRSQTSNEAKTLAEKSLEAGYLKDAVKYLRIAHENDPVDFHVMLKLGWAYNMLKDDQEAIEWFRLARRSSDPVVAQDADRAYRNLRSGLARVHTSTWVLPFYSSRWKDVFTYAQVKTEYKLSNLPVRLYLSTRFSGDTRGSIHDPSISINPQGLSESAAIPGIGASFQPWRGTTFWGKPGIRSAIFIRKIPAPTIVAESRTLAVSAIISSRRIAASSVRPLRTASSSAALKTTFCCTRKTSSAGHFCLCARNCFGIGTSPQTFAVSPGRTRPNKGRAFVSALRACRNRYCFPQMRSKETTP